ncbi:hypothetical protein CK203_019618 [Vitis vinifera]|uniref:Uncharacterized protein n=1 Tax=Vitis vinifera TaxID=29760 RepID=A0A438JQV5_VITVI|nr:hypothetical protein CK203_019618 [Vitis vinifera]
MHLWSDFWEIVGAYGSQQSNASNGERFEAEMKELQPLEADHTKLKANFAGLRNQPLAAKSQRTAAKSAFGCEMVSFMLRNFAALLHGCEILLKLLDICDRHFEIFLLYIFDV